MTYITIDTNKKQGQLFLEYVRTLPFVKIHKGPDELKNESKKIKPLTAKDVAFGIGRKATKAEMKEYIERSELSESLDLADLITAFGK
ncbi:MAG: hypothetical protein WCO54_03240 [Bacteroidota bacterium]